MHVHEVEYFVYPMYMSELDKKYENKINLSIFPGTIIGAILL